METFYSKFSRHNLESSDDGSVGTIAVLDAHWSVITKYRGVFDLMNIDQLRSSVPATIGRPLSSRAGADQLLTSDINPFVVTRLIYIKVTKQFITFVVVVVILKSAFLLSFYVFGSKVGIYMYHTIQNVLGLCYTFST